MAGVGKVGEGALRASQISGCGVEDGVLFGKARSPAARVGKGALPIPWGLEDGAGEDAGDGRLFLFRGRRLSAWNSKAAVRCTRLAEDFVHPGEVLVV